MSKGDPPVSRVVGPYDKERMTFAQVNAMLYALAHTFVRDRLDAGKLRDVANEVYRQCDILDDFAAWLNEVAQAEHDSGCKED